MSITSNAELAERVATAIPIDSNGIGNMWPVFGDPALFNEMVTAVAHPFADASVTKVVAIEARGFVLGAAVARELNAGFVGIRKPGGLYPGDLFEHRTPPDYRGNEFVLRLSADALNEGDRVILVDDWFETGGQAQTAINLISRSSAEFLGSSIVVDWLSDETRTKLGPVHSLLNVITLPL